DFAKPLVNSGRLSAPTPYVTSSLNTVDEEDFEGRMTPGTCCADAPVRVGGKDAWFLNQIGDGFTLLVFGDEHAEDVANGNVGVEVLRVGKDIDDADGKLADRYDGRPGTVYLIRPDQHVAARWRHFNDNKVQAALKTAIGAE
ncbi:MAG: FAD-dependent oxidoreductase, partial [Roseibium sp.]|nr:FAD-dependent oxidoreductase [Roseibium sp.]